MGWGGSRVVAFVPPPEGRSPSLHMQGLMFSKAKETAVPRLGGGDLQTPKLCFPPCVPCSSSNSCPQPEPPGTPVLTSDTPDIGWSQQRPLTGGPGGHPLLLGCPWELEGTNALSCSPTDPLRAVGRWDSAWVGPGRVLPGAQQKGSDKVIIAPSPSSPWGAPRMTSPLPLPMSQENRAGPPILEGERESLWGKNRTSLPAPPRHSWSSWFWLSIAKHSSDTFCMKYALLRGRLPDRSGLPVGVGWGSLQRAWISRMGV